MWPFFDQTYSFKINIVLCVESGKPQQIIRLPRESFPEKIPLSRAHLKPQFSFTMTSTMGTESFAPSISDDTES